MTSGGRGYTPAPDLDGLWGILCLTMEGAWRSAVPSLYIGKGSIEVRDLGATFAWIEKLSGPDNVPHMGWVL